MSTSNTNPVLGVVVLMRHGDRAGYYQNPTTYTSTGTTITPLGEQQAYQMGSLLRARYLNANSPNFIPSLTSVANSGLFDDNAISVFADNGGEGGVIFESVTAAFQGMFPPSLRSNTTLANGTSVISPLGGYQYIAVTTVNPANNISLEPWNDCPAFDKWTTSVYNSPPFRQIASDNAAFLQSLVPIVEGRNVTLSNMYNIFDFINVNRIHNSTIAPTISDQVMGQTRDLANYHEEAIFTDPDMKGIGNLAGRTILPQVFSSLNSFTNSSVKSRMSFIGIAYKPFLSIANMTSTESQAYGMINYAGSLALEVRQAMSGSGYVVRMNFKNGTDDADYRALTMFNSTNIDYPLDQFTDNLSPYLLPTLGDWCNACQNTETGGCDAITAAALGMGGSVTTTYGKHQVSPLAAGFIGAGVTLVVVLMAFGLFALKGLLSFRKRGRNVTFESGSSSNSLQRKKH